MNNNICDFDPVVDLQDGGVFEESIEVSRDLGAPYLERVDYRSSSNNRKELLDRFNNFFKKYSGQNIYFRSTFCIDSKVDHEKQVENHYGWCRFYIFPDGVKIPENINFDQVIFKTDK